MTTWSLVALIIACLKWAHHHDDSAAFFLAVAAIFAVLAVAQAITARGKDHPPRPAHPTRDPQPVRGHRGGRP